MSSEDNKLDKNNVFDELNALGSFLDDNNSEKKMDPNFNIVIDDHGEEEFSFLFDNCSNTEREESDIIDHLKEHFPEKSDHLSQSHRIDKKEIECIDLTEDNVQEGTADPTKKLAKIKPILSQSLKYTVKSRNL